MNVGLGLRRLTICTWLAVAVVGAAIIAQRADLYRPFETHCDWKMEASRRAAYGYSNCFQEYETSTYRGGMADLAKFEVVWTGIVVGLFVGVRWIAAGFKRA